ncbi:FRAT-87 protein, partial [Faecalibaculum rodentium]
MTKDEMIAKLTPAIGDTAYGKELIAALEATFDDADKKYGQDALDRLHDRLGFLEYYMKRDAEMGEEAKSAA